MDTLLLPPANEVCEGCFYTCLSFCSRGGGCRPRLEVKGSGRGGVGPHPGGWGGVSQHVPRQTPQQTATAAGGTHPTGMHSCFT